MKLEKGDTLAKIIDRVASKYPKNEAIVSGKQRINYETLMNNVNSMANALLKMGVKKGDKVKIAECRRLSKTKHFVVIEKM